MRTKEDFVPETAYQEENRRNEGVRHRGIVRAPYIIRYRDGCMESAGCDYSKAVETAKGKAHLHGGIELII